MPCSQPVNRLLVNVASDFAQQLMSEQAPAHPDLSMDTPDRQFDAFLPQREMPGTNMIVDAIDECAVEIEEKWGSGRHVRRIRNCRASSPPVCFSSTFGRDHLKRRGAVAGERGDTAHENIQD